MSGPAALDADIQNVLVMFVSSFSPEANGYIEAWTVDLNPAPNFNEIAVAQIVIH